MDSYKKLFDNSLIFAVGNLGSKLISFFLVPIYTYYLSTEEYGEVDLIMVTVLMLLPIVSLSIFQAVFRFVMDREHQRHYVMTNGMLIAFIGMGASLLFYPILMYFGVLGENLIYLYLILFIQIFERIFSHFTRAIGKIRVYAMNGILLTFATGIFNIYFLVYLRLGVSGYYLATILSHLVSVIFLIIGARPLSYVKVTKVSKKTINNLLRFSVPLIPSSIMWWLVNTSSRYFIIYFSGISANGLFAVASKIPSLINLINNIFTQAWQISAVEEYKSKNQSEFYTKVFMFLASILFITSSFFIGINKPLFSLLFSHEYYLAWIAAPFLIMGTVFSSFSSFLEMNYIAAKQTSGVLKTSVYGGVISLILNFLLIPSLGIIGAGISSMVSFGLVFLIRFFDLKKYVNMEVDWILCLKSSGIVFLQIVILFLEFPKVFELIIQLILFLFMLLVHRKIVIQLIRMNFRA